jgi:hemolysin activation/secretion protein
MSDRPRSILVRFPRALALLAALSTSCLASAADLQDPVDRADAAVIEEGLQDDAAPTQRPATPEITGDVERGDGVTPGQVFIAGAILVEGSSVLPPQAFAAAIEPYLGRDLSPDDLRGLARDVAAVARTAGYGLATAWIPPQNVVNGILRVRVDEGRIDAVEVDGPAQALVEPRLAPLADGRPVTTVELERRLRIAGDLPGVTVGQARLLRRGGRSILSVSTGYERTRGHVWLDNWGTDDVGPYRLRASLDFNGVVAAGDRLSIGGVVTPLQPDEFKLISGGYSLPVGRNGTELQARGYIGSTDAGADLREFDIEGTSHEISLGATHPLVRSRNASLWAIFELSLRNSDLSRRDVLIREDRIAAATAGLYGAGRVAGGFARVRLSVVQGLDILDATRRGDRLASRADGDGVFTKVGFWADYSRNLGGRFSFNVSGEGQLASRPLLSSEEMGLGGQSYLRGYQFRELAGDRGAAVATELRFDLRDLPRPLRQAQLYVFADAGHVSDLQPGTGGGSLAAAGAGVRISAHHGIDASLEFGVPLRDGAFGRRPDPRLSFTLGIRF